MRSHYPNSVQNLLRQLDELDEKEQRSIAGGMYDNKFAAVREAITKLTVDCLPEIEATLAGPDNDWIKMQAIEIAAGFSDPAAEKILQAAAKSKSKGIRVSAQRALESRSI